MGSFRTEPLICIDDSDVVKPDGRKFEILGLVRDGSKSTDPKNIYEKGYHVTETCVFTSSNHPVSIFSRVHYSKEKDFTSVNDITFSATERGSSLFGKVAFVMNRDYDDIKRFLKLSAMEQDYVIRLTSKQKLRFHKKWFFAARLHEQRNGRIKTPVFYKEKECETYLSHVRVQITASRKDICLVLVYGITELPMMLATNKEIKSKEDVIRIARLYFSRWSIMQMSAYGG